MKYYAVTNDPAELMHYGIKGMKWGVIRTDAQLGHPSKPKKPRSAAYKKAESKLGKMMKSGIDKAKANWAVRNSPENQAYRAYKKAEKRFEKHLQKAREGRLRYKGISDAEVARITNRLALERQSRSLSGAEKPKFIRRLGSAAGEGVLRGTSSYINARMEGRGRTTAEIKKAKRLARFEANSRYQRRVAKNEAKQNYYREQAAAGEPMTRTGSLVRMGLSNAYYNAREMAAENDGDSREVARIQAARSAYNRKTGMNLLGAYGRASVVKQRKLENERLARQKRMEDLRDTEYYKALGKQNASKLYSTTSSGTKHTSTAITPITRVVNPRVVSSTGASLSGFTINPHLKTAKRKKRH